MGAFYFRILAYIIDLVTLARLGLASALHVYAQLWKQFHFFRFLRVPSCRFVRVRCNQSFTIAPKMTGSDDTFQTLTDSPF